MKRPELYGVSELAARWGVSRQRADQIVTKQVARSRLGPPAELKCGRVWTADQILKFEQHWVRESGKRIP